MRRRELLLYLFFFTVSLFLYLANFSSSRYVFFLTDTFYRLLLPVVELKARITDGVKDTIKTYLYLVDVEKRNRELLKEVQRLYIYKSQLESCRISLDSISDLLRIEKGNYKRGILFARVIGYDPSGRNAFILIDKGKDYGLEIGFVVFFNENLVGLVERVFASSARVKTIYSDDFTVSAIVESTRTNCIYRGGWGSGRLLYVNMDEPIKAGDRVLLRDNRDIIPAFFIGKVDSVEKSYEQFFKKVSVKPLLSVRNLEYVAIIEERL
ncbi:MAG: rod shape-determining protein MreC [Aquificaceae bacterium]